MYFNFSNHKIVYSPSNRKVNYKNEVTELAFKKSAVEIPISPAVRAQNLRTLIPSFIDIGFTLVTKALGKLVKKYTGEYTAKSSFLEAGSRSVADVFFSRKIQLHSEFENAIAIDLKAVKVDGVNAFYYYIDRLSLDFSMAKTTSKSIQFDYAIEVIPVFLVNGSKKAEKLEPIVLPSVKFGTHTYDSTSYRSDFISLPTDGFFVGASIKIVESNPAKIHTEEIVELFTDTTSDLKKLVKAVAELGKKE